MTDAALNKFWFDLFMALSKREIPAAKRTDRAADIGWGRGWRLLIDSQDRITHPEGRFVPLASVTADVEGFADAIQAMFRLKRRERQVLDMLRNGAETYRHATHKTVKVGEAIVRQSTLDRLCLLGLVQELGYGSDSEYVAVQPESVKR